MRVLALDLGSKRIGVAVSDRSGTIATPLTVLARSGDVARDHARIAALVAEEEAGRVIVGLPLSLDGSLGPAARAAQAETEALAGAVPVPVEAFDERLTTVTADRALTEAGMRADARRLVVDKVAAAVILQAWLDRRAGMDQREVAPPSSPSA
ncbi:MAG TPA: Holliday junction resolvase RuvX [Acidimicrobiales bacterium]|nr:Holliday junction resolvase RuvX [Acidimicrobiales bacterium]